MADAGIGGDAGGGMLHNGNFDMTALVLRFEVLGQALAQAAFLEGDRSQGPDFERLARAVADQTLQHHLAAL
ncbi:hypothetical protein [Azospirillum endophyticum]|uniref:hypothetical protein n=1 Tax=Azospirillum endophyticum TaxID=2800326 RepID=UPI0031F30AFE